MSLEMNTFVPNADDNMIPLWMERMAGLGMNCEIYPGFSFNNHSGFLPFKVRIKNPAQARFAGSDFLTGFEFYISDFSLQQEIELARPKQTISDRLFHKKPKDIYFASPEIDQILNSCTKVLSFVWGDADDLELRMAMLSSIILADLFHGISYYPADDIWYKDSKVLDSVLKEIEAYEASIKPEDSKLHKFEKWL